MEPITLILLYIFGALLVALFATELRPARPLLAFAPVAVCGRCRGRGYAYV